MEWEVEPLKVKRHAPSIYPFREGFFVLVSHHQILLRLVPVKVECEVISRWKIELFIELHQVDE